mmetsp:Transcript_4370/g.15955  ORF Transcript_4370/g.15955 Transcript_4370/m.15955 type:complete len:316 (+) Transcript_4370:2197-3144(+)
MPEGVGERGTSLPVLAVHIRRPAQQELDQPQVPLARRDVQRCSTVVVGLVDFHAVGEEALDLLLLVPECELAEENSCLRAGEGQRLILRSQQRGELVVPVPHSIVQSSVLVLVLDRDAGSVLQEKLGRLHLALASSHMERRPPVRVCLVDVQSNLEEPLHLVRLPPPCSCAEGGDMFSLPPLVQERYLLLDVGQDDRIKVRLLLHRLLVRRGQADLVLVSFQRLLPLLDDLLRRPQRAEARNALPVPARPSSAPSILGELELPQSILRHHLLVVGVRLEDRHDLRPHQLQADRSRPARPRAVDVSDPEEEAQVPN